MQENIIEVDLDNIIRYEGGNWGKRNKILQKVYWEYLVLNMWAKMMS